MGLIKIGKPYIEDNGETTRMIAVIDLPDGTKRKLFFEVESQYGEYLCTERSDAFIVMLLLYAMYYGHNLEWDIPADEDLVYQLRTVYIPTIAKSIKVFKPIRLNGILTTERLEKNRWAVATGASGGVDSFYTVLSHLGCREVSHKLTHLFYVSISNNVTSINKLRDDFETGKKKILKIAKEVDLPLVTMFSNESEFYFPGVVQYGVSMIYVGMVYAIQKLFSFYYLSSGYQYADFQVDQYVDCAHYDLLSLFCVSNKNLKFYSVGGEVSRAEKVRYIEKYSVTQKTLHVCNFDETKNCSLCDKCFRTMLTLDADNALEEYDEIFNLQLFKKYRNKYLARLIYRKNDYDKEILERFKEVKYNIPFISIFKGHFLRPFYIIWQRVQENEKLMKVFYAFNLDYILYSKEMADSIRYDKNVFGKNNNKF